VLWLHIVTCNGVCIMHCVRVYSVPMFQMTILSPSSRGLDIIQVDAEVTEKKKCVGYTRRPKSQFTEIVKYATIIIFIFIRFFYFIQLAKLWLHWLLFLSAVVALVCVRTSHLSCKRYNVLLECMCTAWRENRYQRIAIMTAYLCDKRQKPQNAVKFAYLLIKSGDIVVKALHYKLAGRGLDSRWCHLNFSVT
jgi:hypothetical protein